MITFKPLSTVTASIAFCLFLSLLLIPEMIFQLFQIQEHPSAFFIGRRAAMLFLGIAIFSWVSRNAPHSDARQGMCLGLAISMLALAILGLVEYVRDFAGVGIMLAIVTEVLLAAAYFNVWFCNKKVNDTK